MMTGSRGLADQYAGRTLNASRASGMSGHVALSTAAPAALAPATQRLSPCARDWFQASYASYAAKPALTIGRPRLTSLPATRPTVRSVLVLPSPPVIDSSWV